ncbi:hypothetical protein L0F63_003862 [Massospora cicadina]|nr:hypothetical protein L0F63_003862 [Massospora cicadina]
MGDNFVHACQIAVLNRKPHGLTANEVDESLIFRFLYLVDPKLTVGQVRTSAKLHFEKLYDLTAPSPILLPGFEFSRFFNDHLCEIDDDYTFGHVFSGPCKLYVAVEKPAADVQNVATSENPALPIIPEAVAPKVVQNAVSSEAPALSVKSDTVAPRDVQKAAASETPSLPTISETVAPKPIVKATPQAIPRKRAKKVVFENTAQGEVAQAASQNKEAGPLPSADAFKSSKKGHKKPGSSQPKQELQTEPSEVPVVSGEAPTVPPPVEILRSRKSQRSLRLFNLLFLPAKSLNRTGMHCKWLMHPTENPSKVKHASEREVKQLLKPHLLRLMPWLGSSGSCTH